MKIYKFLKTHYKEMEAIPIVDNGETIGYYIPSEVKFVNISDFNKADSEWFTRLDIKTNEHLYQEFKAILDGYPKEFLERFTKELRVEATERFLANIGKPALKIEANQGLDAKTRDRQQRDFYVATTFDKVSKKFVKKVFASDEKGGRGLRRIDVNDLRQKFNANQIDDLVNGKINFLTHD